MFSERFLCIEPGERNDLASKDFLETDSVLASLDVPLARTWGVSRWKLRNSWKLKRIISNVTMINNNLLILLGSPFHHFDVGIAQFTCPLGPNGSRSGNCFTSEGISTLLPACAKLKRLDRGHGDLGNPNLDWLNPRNPGLFMTTDRKCDWKLFLGQLAGLHLRSYDAILHSIPDDASWPCWPCWITAGHSRDLLPRRIDSCQALRSVAAPWRSATWNHHISRWRFGRLWSLWSSCGHLRHVNVQINW